MHDHRRDHRTDFGTFIAIHREHRGEIGTTLAAICGVSQSVYSNWERNKALPRNEEQVRALAAALQVDSALLLEIWRHTRQDVEAKGPAIVTSARTVTSNGGRTHQEPYTRRSTRHSTKEKGRARTSASPPLTTTIP